MSCIERFHDMRPYQEKLAALARLPAGTIGREMADTMQARGLNLVPGFESHDLKHVVLNYALEPMDEIRLQAFMLGNGNRTLPSVLIFLFGLLLLPQHWRIFHRDFRAGRACPALASLTIEQCQHYQLHAFQQQLLSRYVQSRPAPTPSAHAVFGTLGSYALMVVGAAAMLFCFPFLWSANVADLIGAGFPFVAGAIFVVGGFLNLTLQSALRARAAAE
ncbi:hypothetical protein [Hymenobacter jeollabukensis]|nr:hypothetical protein [Hymenobacter jeollabukensis]